MEKMKDFLLKAENDKELTTKLNELTKENAGAEAFAALAAEHGFNLTAEDFDKLNEKPKTDELDLDDLEEVSGGDGRGSVACKFEGTGGLKDGKWLKCKNAGGFWCTGLGCGCHGRACCKDGWHYWSSNYGGTKECY